MVATPLKLKITNRTAEAGHYAMSIADCPEARIVSAENPIGVAAGASLTVSFSIEAPPNLFTLGRRDVWLQVSDGNGFVGKRLVKLLGPMTATAPSAASAPSAPSDSATGDKP